MPGPRVLLADDHAIVLQGLRLLLKDRCELVGTVSDGTSLVAAALELRPDIIVADISMPGCDGLQAVRRLRELGVTSKVIMLTMYEDPELAEETIAAGADGYVIKHSAADELFQAIREVSAGKKYVTPFLDKRRPRR
jgi:DNA-binding NarL/FixJ family response regulator